MRLENGRSRAASVGWVMTAAAGDPELVAGFDFAFSFPEDYCAARGWRSATEVWGGVARTGETLLRECPPPFWGRPGVRRPHPPGAGLRRTDREDVPGAKSVFQIGGAGAVGTGSLRGIPHLLTLRNAGFGVWPFDGPGRLPLVCEIYPRVFYGAGVRKRRREDRVAVLRARFADQAPELLARAAGSEDAFDAAVSALVMSAHAGALRGLPAQPGWELEGRVWTPDRCG